jgi:hypothetical protein
MFNLKLAFRTLAKTPFVTIVAALSLALGIGSNTAIYSIFDMMLRRPLPVYRPEQLVNLAAPGPNPGSQSCNQAGGCDVVFSYPMLRDLQKATPQHSPFTAIAAHRAFDTNIAYGNLSLNASGMLSAHIPSSCSATISGSPASAPIRRCSISQCSSTAGW